MGEVRAGGKGYMDAYLQFVLRVGRGDFMALVNSPIISMVVQHMLYSLPKDMPPEEKVGKCWAYFASPHFANLPLQDIDGRILATLKAIVKAGAYTNPENALVRLKGFFYDANHIATYAPYCDAFVMDQPMAELVAHPGVALEAGMG